MKAKITVEFILNDICELDDLSSYEMTFEEMVRYLIKEEGLFGLTKDGDLGNIVKIEQVE